jgi:hypothetical protein
MSTVTTSTNVAIIQRDSSGNNAWVNLLGSTNANKALGFSSVGAVTALSVPLLASANTFTAANTFSALQTVAVTSAASGADLLYLGRSGETTDGTNQQVRFIAGNGPEAGNGFLFAHYSRTSGAQTAKNYLRFYDEGLSVDNASAAKMLDINTTTQTVAVTSELHSEQTYGKLHIGGTFQTSLTNNVRAVRVDATATLGAGYAYACFDAAGISAGSANIDHIVGFQSRPKHECTGTLTTLYGAYCRLETYGGLTTNAYGSYISNTIGSGSISNQYGIYIESLAKGGNNFAIVTAGTTPSSFGGNITARAFIGTDAVVAAAAIDWATGASFTKTLSASTTFTFANSLPGQEIRVAITNTASNYTVAWPASPTLKWSGGSAPTQTIGAKTDVYTFVNVGGVIYGSVVQNF